MTLRRCWLIAAGLSAACTAQHPVSLPEPNGDALACVPSRPAVSPLDTVALTVAPHDSAASYVWTTSGGRLLDRGQGAGREAAERWSLRDAGLGFHEASVTATWRDGRRERCTVRVRVVPPGGTMGGGLPARSFLTRGAPERDGYGLYSYLLLGAAPDGSARSRYRRAIEEYVRLLPSITAYGDTANRSAFNINYLPVNAAPASDHADSVLASYDYARAQTLLAALPGARLAGPYLVSARRPLSAGAAASGGYVLQDLSTVPDTLVGLWVKEFLAQATQEPLAANPSLRGFALRLRTLIGVVAIGLPDVAQSMAEWKNKWTSWVTTQPSSSEHAP